MNGNFIVQNIHGMGDDGEKVEELKGRTKEEKIFAVGLTETWTLDR